MADTKLLVSDNPSQVSRLEGISKLVIGWVENAAIPEIAMRREMNKNSVTSKDISFLIEKGTGKNILDALRENFIEFISAEKTILADL